MKIKIIIVLVFSLLIQSCKKDKVHLTPNNELKKFSTVKEQIFDLDTLSFSEIKGENGTLIYFNKSDFDVKKGRKVKVILKEYYRFSDLVFNNINTLTDKNELLESSGVIYLEFQSNGKKIKLKKNKFIEIRLPKKQLKNSQIFYAKFDSLGQITWKKDITKFIKVIRRIVNVNYGITADREYILPVDSLSFYNEKWEKEMLDYQDKINRAAKIENYAIRFLSNQYNITNYINFDSFIKSGVKLIDFEIEVENRSIEQLTFYVFYKNKKSFVSIYKTIDDLNFTKIPFIKNETSLFVVGNDNGKTVSGIIVLKENPNKKFKIKLKKYTKKQIQDLLKR